jgi:hypothetical protein
MWGIWEAPGRLVGSSLDGFLYFEGGRDWMDGWNVLGYDYRIGIGNIYKSISCMLVFVFCYANVSS